MNEQSNNRKELDDIKKQMADATQHVAPAGTQTATTVPVFVPRATGPDGPALAHDKIVKEYLDEGFRLLNLRDPQSAAQAAKIFREGIDKVDRTNVFFYNGLGRSLMITGKNADALQAFLDGQREDPKRAELVSGAGWAYWNLKQYYMARESWEKALKLDPKSQDAWMALAWIYMAMGKSELSAKGFVILLELQPDSKEWTTGLNMARSGNTNLDQIRAQFNGLPDPVVFITPPITSSAPAK
jgi:tetratricopeptide (TPR) repeat protein